jgi:hypothetical protein
MSEEKKSNQEVSKVDTLLVRICEEQTLWIVRDSININISEYPELEGMSEEEMQEYIKDNSSEMAAPSNCNWADSLYDALVQQDVIREKDTNYDTFVYFD